MPSPAPPVPRPAYQPIQPTIGTKPHVCGEVFLVAPVVDRIQGRFLKDEGSVHDVSNGPLAFAVLLILLSLAGGALLQATGPTDLALDDFPGHGCSPAADDYSILLHLPKMLFSPTQPLIRPRLFPI